MKLFKEVGWWLPSHEKHLQEWMLKQNDKWDGRLAYQGKKIRLALELAKEGAERKGHNMARDGVAIDIGAHCGLWSFYLAQFFANVSAFEPIEEHRLCFKANVEADNVLLLPYALGLEDGEVGFHTEPSSSGDTYVSGKGTIPVKRLDDGPHINSGQPVIDLIKADCEGYELFALQGGQDLIRAHRPVIVVEQKFGKAQKFGLRETQAVEYLKELGMRLEREIAGDYFMSWP